MFNKLKQIQELRKQAKELQNSLSAEAITSESEKSLIKVTVDGNHKVKNVEIDNNLLNIESKEKLENGLLDAYNKATDEVQKMMARKVQSGDISMPNIPGFN